MWNEENIHRKNNFQTNQMKSQIPYLVIEFSFVKFLLVFNGKNKCRFGSVIDSNLSTKFYSLHDILSLPISFYGFCNSDALHYFLMALFNISDVVVFLLIVLCFLYLLMKLLFSVI